MSLWDRDREDTVRRCFILIFVSFLYLSLLGCSQYKKEGLLKPDGLLCDFEDLSIWDISPEKGFSLKLNKKFKTQGKYSLKVVYPKGGLPSINTRRLCSNWENFNYLVFDVYNPQNEVISFVIRIDDKYRRRINISYPLIPNWNKVIISIKEIAERIDINNVGFVVLFLKEPSKRYTLYFDNMRLCKKEPAESVDLLKRPSHPRLLFTRKDLPLLRKKFQNAPYWLKNELIDYAEKRKNVFVLGFMYQLINEKKYARKAIDIMLKKRVDNLEKWSLSFDWCYQEMSDEERAKIARKIEKSALNIIRRKKRYFRSFHNMKYYLTTAIAAAGYALEGESRLAKMFIEFANLHYKDSLAMFNKVFVDGGWHEGMDYNRHVAFPLVVYFEIVRTATGRDLYKECDWLLKNAYFVLYTTRPDNTFYRFADNDFPEITDWERRFLSRVASYYQDPYIQWYVNHKTKPHDYVPRHIYDLLWYDPDLEEKPPYDLPKAKLFRGVGVVIARSGWKESDTWFSFKCGDYFGDHDHLDNGSFTIYKLGNLAIDSGLYGNDFDSSHWHDYHFRTIAHNTILILDPQEKFYGYENLPLVNDGGQKIMLWERGERVVPENYAYATTSLPWTWIKNKERWDVGRINIFKSTEEYCYVVGDVSKAYSAHKLRKFLRHILFIYPDSFVIFDQVLSTNANFKKIWLLHAVNEPIVEDDEVTILEGEGKLWWKVIYPSKFLIRKVGGEGKEFFVDGKNYPHNNKIFPGNIPGSWRIEVESSTSKEDEIFLNFFYTSKVGAGNKPLVEKLVSTNCVGIELELEEAFWVINFASSKTISHLSYEIKRGNRIKNFIFNLTPNKRYRIIQGSELAKTLKTDKYGILEFELSIDKESKIEIMKEEEDG